MASAHGLTLARRRSCARSCTGSGSGGSGTSIDRVTFGGAVLPSHTGQRVLLQRRSAHGWRTIAHPRLNRHSRFSLRERVQSGSLELRAVLGGDARNIRSYSPTVTVVVSAIHKIKHVVVIMQLGNLASDFDFTGPPRAPVILPVHPWPGPGSTPPVSDGGGSPLCARGARAAPSDRGPTFWAIRTFEPESQCHSASSNRSMPSG